MCLAMMPLTHSRFRRLGANESFKQAYKGWNECMEGFLGDGAFRFRRIVLEDNDGKDEKHMEISWSSSDDDEPQTVKKHVVTRLNFDECAARGPLRTTAKVIRSEVKSARTPNHERRPCNKVKTKHEDERNESDTTLCPVLRQKCNHRLSIKPKTEVECRTPHIESIRSNAVSVGSVTSPHYAEYSCKSTVFNLPENNYSAFHEEQVDFPEFVEQTQGNQCDEATSVPSSPVLQQKWSSSQRRSAVVPSIDCARLQTAKYIDSNFEEESTSPVLKRKLNFTAISPVLSAKRLNSVPRSVCFSYDETPTKIRGPSQFIDSFNGVSVLHCAQKDAVRGGENISVDSDRGSSRFDGLGITQPHISISSSSPLDDPEHQSQLCISLESSRGDSGQDENHEGTEGVASTEEIQAISSSGDNSEVSVASGKYGSDWLKRKELHYKSPAQVPPMNDPDSGKKKRKSKTEGLALRLHWLLNRRRSSTHMWYHELPYSAEKLKNEALTLRVQGLCSDFSHTILECSFLQSHVSGNPNPRSEVVSVILDSEFVVQLGVKPRCTINIYPPWKRVACSLGKKVIVGATLIEVVKDTHSQDTPDVSHVEETQVLQEFNCLCQQDPSIDPKECKFKFKKGGVEILEAMNLLPVANIALLNEISDPRRCHTGPKKHLELKGTIAEALVRKSSSEICISVCFERIFHYRKHKVCSQQLNGSSEDDANACWSSLCQDAKGEFCEIVIPHDVAKCSDLWTEALRVGEGESFEVGGLTISQRVNKARSPGLLAIMESVRASVVNELGAGVSGGDQLFLYIFSAAENCTVRRQRMGTRHSISPHISTLFDVLQTEASREQRFTLVVKLVAAVQEHIFVSDPSLATTHTGEYEHAPFVVASVKPLCFFPALEEPSTDVAPVLYLRDVGYMKGKFHIDKYTKAILLSRKEENNHQFKLLKEHQDLIYLTQNCQPSIPELQPTSLAKDLVCAVGNIIGVNEGTALTWPVCGKCHSESLCEVNSNKYYCQKCGIEVEEVNMKMTMEVYIVCPNIPTRSKVKIKLLQESIVQILPAASSDSEYELTYILGKLVGPIFCVVTGRKQTVGSDALEFSLEEIKCFGQLK